MLSSSFGRINCSRRVTAFLPDNVFFDQFRQPESAPLDSFRHILLVEQRTINILPMAATGELVLSHRFVHGLYHHADKEAFKILGYFFSLLALLFAQTGNTSALLLQEPGLLSGIVTNRGHVQCCNVIHGLFFLYRPCGRNLERKSDNRQLCLEGAGRLDGLENTDQVTGRDAQRVKRPDHVAEGSAFGQKHQPA